MVATAMATVLSTRSPRDDQSLLTFGLRFSVSCTRLLNFNRIDKTFSLHRLIYVQNRGQHQFTPVTVNKSFGGVVPEGIRIGTFAPFTLSPGIPLASAIAKTLLLALS